MRGRAQFVGFLGRVADADDVKIHRAKVIDLGDGAAAQLELTGIADATSARRAHLLRRSEASVIGRGQRE
jgi:hypothetical protein